MDQIAFGCVYRANVALVGVSAESVEITLPPGALWMPVGLSCPWMPVGLSRFDRDDADNALYCVILMQRSGCIDKRGISCDGVFPELFDREEPGIINWCCEDSRTALGQGWDIFFRGDANDNGEFFELQRFDDADRFSCDEEAWKFVWLRAVEEKDCVAQRALSFLYYRSPEEFARIEATATQPSRD